MVTMFKQLCAKFQLYFAELYGARGGSGTVVDLTSYLGGTPCLSVRDVEFYKIPTSAKDVRMRLRSAQDRSLRGGTVCPSSFIFLFDGLLADVYHNYSCRGMVALRKDPNEGNKINRFRPVTAECRLYDLGQGVSQEVGAFPR